jgi:hypothetical protein
MISGFFAGLVLSKRTPKRFISDRFVKLGITKQANPTVKLH